MIKLEEMTIFELKEYKELLKEIKEKYGQSFILNNNEEDAKKFNYVQGELNKVEKIIEKIIFKNYDKKGK